ncbi:MAG: hypothetical protein H6810_02275 [Phycisphaeraceae bacterium]|nr:MAG: hypothetical protein H6810_02275 [Phycisphaeraceae bacterium]
MANWLFADHALWFSIPAILGTLYFALHFAFGQLGGDADVDADVDVDVDFDGDVGDSPETEFKVLSLNTISAFAMGSGWMGLGALKLTDLGFGGAAVIAILSGAGIAWVLVTLVRSLMKLQSSGNVRLDSTVGRNGTVYVQIPPAGEGSGRVTLVVDNKQREFNAVQRGSEPIASRTRVNVVDIDQTGNCVMVEVAS